MARKINARGGADTNDRPPVQAYMVMLLKPQQRKLTCLKNN